MTIIIKTATAKYTYWNVESIYLHADVLIVKHTDRPESQLTSDNIEKIIKVN